MSLQIRSITFRKLEVFLTFTSCLSINKTAENLNLSQPTISIQLKKLSDVIGFSLYEVIGKKIQLTAEGELLKKYSIYVFNAVKNLEYDLSALHDLKSGVLTIGMVETATYFIPVLLGEFTKTYSGIEICIKVGNREQILHSAHQGELDFFILSNLPNELDFCAYEFQKNPLVMVAAKSHPLVNAPEVALSSLLKEDFILREVGSETREIAEQFFNQQGMNVQIKLTIASNEGIKEAVKAGLGVSILSEHCLTYGGHDGLSILKVKGFPLVSHWHLCYLAKKQLSHAGQTFLAFMRNSSNDLMSIPLPLTTKLPSSI